jgi:hypothetical protein
MAATFDEGDQNQMNMLGPSINVPVLLPSRPLSSSSSGSIPQELDESGMPIGGGGAAGGVDGVVMVDAAAALDGETRNHQQQQQ